jgi:hypothetical protein
MSLPVIPAKAGIQGKQELLDPGFRRGDGFYDFLRDRQISTLSFLTSPQALLPFLLIQFAALTFYL